MADERGLPPGVDRAVEVRGGHPGPAGAAISSRRRCECPVATWMRKPQYRFRVALVVLAITAYYLASVVLFFTGDALTLKILGGIAVVMTPLAFLTQIALIACAGLDQQRSNQSKVIWCLIIFFLPPVGIPAYWAMAAR